MLYEYSLFNDIFIFVASKSVIFDVVVVVALCLFFSSTEHEVLRTSYYDHPLGVCQSVRPSVCQSSTIIFLS